MQLLNYDFKTAIHAYIQFVNGLKEITTTTTIATTCIILTINNNNTNKHLVKLIQVCLTPFQID